MIGFQLTEEQQMLKNVARDFAEHEIKPLVKELDAKPNPADCFSWDLVRKMSKLGFRTMPVATKYGGGGIDSCLTSCIVAEELSVADPSITAAVMLSGLKMAHLFESATQEQREKYLRVYCEDDEYLVSTSITEPESGVDNVLPYNAPDAGLRTRVVKAGDYFLLSGRKHFIQNAGVSKINLIWARTDPTVGVSDGCTCFIVRPPAEGYSVGHIDDKVGARLAINGDVILENVRVHKNDVLGEWNRGIELFRQMLLHGDNLVNAARMVGVGRAIYEASVAYAKDRVQGGQPIIQHQAVAMDLADMFMEVEAARTFLWYAAWRLDNPDKAPFDAKYGTMASVLCHEMAVRVAVKALPMWGGSGIQREIPVQKHLRDAASFLHADGGVHVKRVLTAGLM